MGGDPVSRLDTVIAQHGGNPADERDEPGMAEHRAVRQVQEGICVVAVNADERVVDRIGHAVIPD